MLSTHDIPVKMAEAVRAMTVRRKALRVMECTHKDNYIEYWAGRPHAFRCRSCNMIKYVEHFVPNPGWHALFLDCTIDTTEDIESDVINILDKVGEVFPKVAEVASDLALKKALDKSGL